MHGYQATDARANYFNLALPVLTESPALLSSI